MPLNGSTKRLSANWILSATCGIALLHFGREVIEPLALAIILSLVIAPLVRKVRRLGLGQTAATLVSVALVGACVIGASMGLAIQVGAVAADLPRYKESIRSKVEVAREITLGSLEKWEADLNGVVPPLSSRLRQAAGKRQTPFKRRRTAGSGAHPRAQTNASRHIVPAICACLGPHR